eukprot:GDKH01000452.1.p2 GENE.GDKH01000452.1~~GDKH01000452.1.p2  ORF type:complete len:215 (+),score=50.43 GDKH01000452.1:112-756(+)
MAEPQKGLDTVGDKSDEKIARELQDLEYQGGPGQQQQQYQPTTIGSNFAQSPGGPNGMVIATTFVGGAPPEGVNIQSVHELYQLGRSVMCFAVLDCVICLLWLMTGIWFMFFLFFCPVAGYMGAQKYDKNMLIAYLVYIGIMIIFRFGYFIYALDVGDGLNATFGIFFVIIECWILNIVIRFYRRLGSASPNDLAFLKTPSYRPTAAAQQIVYI